MTVVYSSSDTFSRIAGVSILSLCINNKETEDLRIYMIDNGISEDNKKKLEETAGMFGRKIIFVQPPDIEKMAGLKINTGRWNISTFERLFLCTILPEEETRALFIDCDTIVADGLAELWKTDMNGKWVCGVDDCRSAAYRTELGLKPGDRYINNGVLLIDLDAWRKNNVERMFLDFIKDRKGDITYADQGVQNGVLSRSGRSGYLHPRYNCMTIFFAFGYDELMRLRKPPVLMDREEFEEAVKDPAIIHFQSCFRMSVRPWERGCVHPYTNIFRILMAMTPWGDEPLFPDSRTIPQKILSAAASRMPESVMVPCISVLHTKIYPAGRMLKRAGRQILGKNS